jgi:HD superfamily phosphohydrolase
MNTKLNKLLEALQMADIEQLGFFDKQVKEQLELLKTEIVTIKREIDPKLTQIEELKQKVSLLENYLNVANTQDYEKQERFLKVVRSKGRTIGDMAVEILDQIGEPTIYTQIISEIETRYNFKIPGKEPNANFLAHLNNDSRIIRTSRATYGLKKWKSNEEGGHPV